MPLTMAEIRAKYPNPITYHDGNRILQRDQVYAVYAKTEQPPCYCVAGAFLLAAGKSWYEEDEIILDGESEDDACVEPVEEVLFPNEFGWDLCMQNSALRGNRPFFADGNSNLGDVYESAIEGANDHDRIDQVEGRVLDHFELAWQLLDDALTFDPATFDPAREYRLLKGVLLKMSADEDYRDPDRPALVAYFARCLARYRELESQLFPPSTT